MSRTTGSPVLAILLGGLALTLIPLMAACGGGDDAGPTGVTTAVPTPTAAGTSDAGAGPTSTATATPEPTQRPPSARPTSTARPTPLSDRLADLGREDSAVIAELLGDLTPRCRQSEEEVVDLLERAWRVLRETYDIALPVTSIISRILVELPQGSSRENCETLITAVITQIVGGPS